MSIQKNRKHSKTRDTARQTGSPKPKQNPLKNKPGLLIGQLKAQVRDNTEFAKVIINNLPNGFLEEDLRRFLDRYQKEMKTWNSLKRYLGGNTKYALIVIELALAFLSEEHKKSFQTWMRNTKQMTEKNKNVFQTRKDYLKQKFEELRETFTHNGECTCAVELKLKRRK